MEKKNLVVLILISVIVLVLASFLIPMIIKTPAPGAVQNTPQNQIPNSPQQPRPIQQTPTPMENLKTVISLSLIHISEPTRPY